MRTVKDVSELTGVSIRALHYYDRIDLLRPTQITEAGYRLYDDKAMEKLQMILLFRELRFPLKEIKMILDNPSFDRGKALEQQIELLTLQKEHIEDLINLARGIKKAGVKSMLDFDAFDTKKIDEYAQKAKELWGETPAYREFEEKARYRTKAEEKQLGEAMMDLFREFGRLLDREPGDETVQAQVKKLQDFITENYYQCTPEILSSLGSMYSGGGSMTENIDKAGGKGTAEFADRAIKIYCSSR